MLNKVLARLNGHATDVDALVAALGEIGQEREAAKRELGELQVRRHQALLDDAADSVLDKLEREIARAETRVQKLDLAEPGVRSRLEAATQAARRRRWSELRADFIRAAEEFHQAAQAAMAKHTALIEIVTRARSEGFEHEAAAMMPPTPNLAGNAVLAEDLLAEFWQTVQRTSATANPPAAAAKPKASAKPAATAIWSPSGDTFAPLPRDVPSLQHAISAVYPPPGSLGFLTAHRAADDTAPLAPGEARVLALHSGWSPRDNAPQTFAGQTLRMDAAAARAAANRGQVEIIETYMPPAAPEPEASPAPGAGL